MLNDLLQLFGVSSEVPIDERIARTLKSRSDLEAFNRSEGRRHIVLNTYRPGGFVVFQSDRVTKGQGKLDADLLKNLMRRGCVGFILARELSGTEVYAAGGPRTHLYHTVERSWHALEGIPVALDVQG